MKLSPEVLMAYADGELDAAGRAEVEAAMASDRTVAAEIARLKAQRAELAGAFNGLLSEPIPPSLLATARTSPAGATPVVADLTQVRARKSAARTPRNWSWPQWISIAASLLLGVLIGRTALEPSASNDLVARNGRIVAEGRLATALSDWIGSSPTQNADIAIGISFRAKSGEFCRTFATGRGSLAGVACRAGEEWRVEAVAANNTGAATGDYRPAGAGLPSAILQIVEASIAGEALDNEEEAAVRARSWRP
jgi:hypothetical protein